MVKNIRNKDYKRNIRLICSALYFFVCVVYSVFRGRDLFLSAYVELCLCVDSWLGMNVCTDECVFVFVFYFLCVLKFVFLCNENYINKRRLKYKEINVNKRDKITV